MDDIERLAAKAKQRADEYNRNVEAAAREKEEAIAFLERTLEAVTAEPGTLGSCSEKIVVSFHGKELGDKPTLKFRGKGVRVLGDDPLDDVEFGSDVPISGKAVFLNDEGKLLRLNYSGRKKFREVDWTARVTEVTPEEIVEEFGTIAPRTIFANLEKALDRHGKGGRDKQTNVKLSEAMRYSVMTSLLELLFNGGKR